jgi:hypothetical protein
MASGTGSAAAHTASSAAMMCDARSPEHTVALLELFTSEGCSSCPPADRWLQGLKGQGLGLDKVVPLSLHVGYWDAIGWKDPYAQARFTDRQRDYARQQRAASVYTPQVVLAGQDFRRWGDAELRSALAAPASRPVRGSRSRAHGGTCGAHPGRCGCGPPHPLGCPAPSSQLHWWCSNPDCKTRSPEAKPWRDTDP